LCQHVLVRARCRASAFDCRPGGAAGELVQRGARAGSQISAASRPRPRHGAPMIGDRRRREASGASGTRTSSVVRTRADPRPIACVERGAAPTSTTVASLRSSYSSFTSPHSSESVSGSRARARRR
jgi:hypothetical protein